MPSPLHLALHLALCLAAGVAAGLVVAAVGVCVWMMSGAETRDEAMV